MCSNDGINETFVLRLRCTIIRQSRRLLSYSFLHTHPSRSTVKTLSWGLAITAHEMHRTSEDILGRCLGIAWCFKGLRPMGHLCSTCTLLSHVVFLLHIP